jgi:hypothetical protein
MLASIVKVKRLDGDAAATLPAGTLIHGILVVSGTLTATASLAIHDAATVTGNPVIEIGTNTADATNYEKYAGIFLPYPLKCYTGVSANITGTSAVAYIYYS